ncbi:MAG TPA: response regulator [Luteimonas sp.]|nr:response regulator [Luteimonas sp.]
MQSEPPLSILAGKWLLIVEDDVALAGMLEEFFSDLGCLVLGPAGTAVAALGLLAGQSVDVALLDVTLPDERSYVVAERLVELGVPFVFATGHQLLPGYAAPAASVLRKPYRPPEVIRAVEEAFSSHADKTRRRASAAQNAVRYRQGEST